MADYIYIDNSNVYIEGRRVSAVANGIAENISQAMSEKILDHAYTIDFGKFYEFLVGDDEAMTKRIVMFGSRPPPNDSIWTHAERAGFELRLEDRNAANKEKKIDTGLATLLTKDAYKNGDPSKDVFIIVSGDSDYVPTIKELQEDNYRVEVVFWSHASKELIDTADKFTSLDSYLEGLRLGG